jgi:hypothetical protein
VVEADAQLEGVVSVKTDALFMIGSSLNGRVLTQTAACISLNPNSAFPDRPATSSESLFGGITDIAPVLVVELVLAPANEIGKFVDRAYPPSTMYETTPTVRALIVARRM